MNEIVERLRVRIFADGADRNAIAELQILPGAARACERLRAAGFILVVVTNQPEVARGTLTADTVEEMHRELQHRLSLDEIAVCFHDDADGCDCRKPQPGLLRSAAERWRIDLTTSFLVGDRWRDVEAARRAGCRAIFVDRGYAEAIASEPDATVRNLEEAAEWILRLASREPVTQ
jgi:D-glycero-D-manno-heptose 1,7-bisphosphate phosphatase